MNYAFNNNYAELQNLRDKIDQQIKSMQPAPINNIINTASVDLEAKYLKQGEDIQNILIKNRTLFIDEQNNCIKIKELDGSISKEYKILVPKDPKDEKIENLEKQVNEMRCMLNEYAKHNTTIITDEQSNAGDNDIIKPTTKKGSK